MPIDTEDNIINRNDNVANNDCPKPADYEQPYVAKWDLYVGTSKACGRYLASRIGIDNANEIILELCPVNILEKQNVVEFNRVVQVSDNLYSSSVSKCEYNNFICHSCEPNCTLEILPDYTVLVRSTRRIAAHESLCIDYNETEWDMIEQGVDFHCQCGTPSCRQWIRGKRYLINK